MLKQSNKSLGYDDEYHQHCDMCEMPVKEWLICEKCFHVECSSCWGEYATLGRPLGHPCAWIIMKNDCAAKREIEFYAKD